MDKIQGYDLREERRGDMKEQKNLWKKYKRRQSVRATRAEHSRRFLSLNYAIEYVTTHLQEIPQRIR